MNQFLSDNLLAAIIIPGAIALLALLLAAFLYLSIRRLRRDQRVVLGEGGGRDMIRHARDLEQGMTALGLEIKRLEGDLAFQDKRLDDCFTYRSVVRYDAYRDLSGMQSTSVCLLDTRFSGVIFSSIQSRDHARIYVKEVRHGESREQLSPEEIQVLKESMGLKDLGKQARPARGSRAG